MGIYAYQRRMCTLYFEEVLRDAASTSDLKQEYLFDLAFAPLRGLCELRG